MPSAALAGAALELAELVWLAELRLLLTSVVSDERLREACRSLLPEEPELDDWSLDDEDDDEDEDEEEEEEEEDEPLEELLADDGAVRAVGPSPPPA